MTKPRKLIYGSFDVGTCVLLDNGIDIFNCCGSIYVLGLFYFGALHNALYFRLYLL